SPRQTTTSWPASAFLRRNRADVVHLAEVDAVVAEDRVRHRRMEEEVRQRQLHQVVVAAEPLPAEPGWRHLPLLPSGQVLRLDGLEEAQALPYPLAQLGERLLRIRVGGRRLAAEVRGRVLRLVAGRLHLADERVLIRRQAGLGEHVDLEGFGLRVRGGLVHPQLEVLQGLGEQPNGIVVVHAILLSRAWDDSPRRTLRRHAIQPRSGQRSHALQPSRFSLPCPGRGRPAAAGGTAWRNPPSASPAAAGPTPSPAAAWSRTRSSRPPSARTSPASSPRRRAPRQRRCTRAGPTCAWRARSSRPAPSRTSTGAGGRT